MAAPREGAALTCPGCALRHPPLGLEPVAGLDATGECAREFGRVSAPFYADPALVPQRQYVVDAYACQHPSTVSRRAVQTTALCLMTLDLVLEVGVDVALGSRLHREMMRTRPALFVPLRRPDLSAATTYRHVAEAGAIPQARTAAARAWAASVWAAWSEHHDQVRSWNRALVPHRLS